MTYFKINNTDFSMYVNELKVSKEANYNAQTNAAGNTVVDLINHKRTVEVGIIPVTSEAMAQLQLLLDSFNVTITYLNPNTNALDTINCIIPDSNVEYYTIQAGNVSFKAFSLKFTEL
jgi:hypothetical protein